MALLQFILESENFSRLYRKTCTTKRYGILDYVYQNGKLVGKTAEVFQSTGTMQGEQESVAMNCMSFFAHQGMVFITLGYVDPKVFSYEEIHGGSPWGSETYSGPDGWKQPTSMELSIAENHGRHFAKLTAKISA